MATPNEKLADSLLLLKKLQTQGGSVLRSRALSRVHRERLVKAGFLQEVVKGWYVPARPMDEQGSSTTWYAGMREFITGYCNERFGQDWHVAPEQSLLLRTGERTLPLQVQIWAPAGSNQGLALPHGCSLFLYRAPRLLPAQPFEDTAGLRLAQIAPALVAVSPGFFTQQTMAARIALASLSDAAELLTVLLDGSHSVVAGRLAGAVRAVGRTEMADEIVHTMRSAGYTVNETQPFEVVPSPLPGGRPESPYVQRMRLTWVDMRQKVIDAFPEPGPVPTDVERTIADVQERYVADAWNSLSIEGYRVTAELIERIRNGTWEPDRADKEARDAMAAKGYFDAHKLVIEFVAATLPQPQPGFQVRDALSAWYRALFSPGVQAGLLKPSDLAGWRNDQVFIRGALHVPLSKEAVRECMPVLFELLAQETHPAVRAMLGHFVFVYIHPYMDGNGRLARFLMNAMLVTGGYVWTIVPMSQRKTYMEALAQASSFQDIAPLAKFVGDLVREQTNQPLSRPTA